MTAEAARHASTGWIGRPVRRVEDRSLVTGAGCYVDDVRPPGTLSLAILRSPHPHARIASVDASAARAAAGVVDVVEGRETAHLTRLTVNPVVPDVRKPLHLPLAVDEVRYVGDEVAAVLAEERDQARDALDLIEVDYEPLPGVAEADVALAGGAPPVHAEFGDNLAYARAFGSSEEEVAAAFERADRLVSFRVRHPRLAPVAVEPRAVLASFDAAEGTLTVWTSTQRPFFVRDELAAMLDLPPERVRVVAPDIGGGFGSKGALYREEVLAAFLSKKHGRPVRWMATRSEEFLTTMHARDQADVVDAGFGADGALEAIRVRIQTNLGAYLQVNTPLPATRTARLICGAYRVPVARAEIEAAFTNTAPTGPYRGAGRPEACFMVERLMDVAAAELGIDPLELRRRNFIRPDDFPWRVPTGLTYDSGSYERTLEHALEMADYPRLIERREEARRRGGLFGIGVSTFIEPSGGPGWESGRIWVEPDGTVRVGTGSSAHGQGHHTVFAQIVAERLQVPFEQVCVAHGDTASSPAGIGTFGSRSTALGGSALLLAADSVLAKMRRIAAHLLEVEESDLTYQDGAFGPIGVPGRAVSFAEIAAVAYDPVRLPPGLDAGIEAQERFDTEQQESYSHGTHVAAVRVDRDTGRIDVETLVAVDDGGVIVNPLLAEGQVHGGLAQGIGQALQEHMLYDADGTVITGSLGDYSVPHALDVPTLRVGETRTPSPLNPLGAKGVGESGAVGVPPAVVNAVYDALRDYAVEGLQMPLTSEKVWAVLQRGPRQ